MMRNPLIDTAFWDEFDELMYRYVGNDLVTSAEIELAHEEFDMARFLIDTAMNVIAFRQQVGGREYKVSGYIYYKQGQIDEGRNHLERAIAAFREDGQELEIEEVKNFLREL